MFKCTYGSIEKEKQAIDAAIRAGVKGILLLCAQGDNYNSKVLELALNGLSAGAYGPEDAGHFNPVCQNR